MIMIKRRSISQGPGASRRRAEVHDDAIGLQAEVGAGQGELLDASNLGVTLPVHQSTARTTHAHLADRTVHNEDLIAALAQNLPVHGAAMARVVDASDGLAADLDCEISPRVRTGATAVERYLHNLYDISLLGRPIVHFQLESTVLGAHDAPTELRLLRSA